MTYHEFTEPQGPDRTKEEGGRQRVHYSWSALRPGEPVEVDLTNLIGGGAAFHLRKSFSDTMRRAATVRSSTVLKDGPYRISTSAKKPHYSITFTLVPR